MQSGVVYDSNVTVFMLAIVKCAFKGSKRSLSHGLSHSASEKSRGFLLLLCGDMWRQEL